MEVGGRPLRISDIESTDPQLRTNTATAPALPLASVLFTPILQVQPRLFFSVSGECGETVIGSIYKLAKKLAALFSVLIKCINSPQRVHCAARVFSLATTMILDKSELKLNVRAQQEDEMSLSDTDTLASGTTLVNSVVGD